MATPEEAPGSAEPRSGRTRRRRWRRVAAGVVAVLVVVVGIAAEVLDACRAVGSVTLTDIDGNRGETYPAL